MCQGVAVQAQGACGNEDADLLDTSGDLPSVTIDVMTRFRGRGFKYVPVDHTDAQVSSLWEIVWHLLGMPFSCWPPAHHRHSQLCGQRQGGPFRQAYFNAD